nr:MAG TPA: hypothetical protein [Caudoviricetes sp.]
MSKAFRETHSESQYGILFIVISYYVYSIAEVT